MKQVKIGITSFAFRHTTAGGLGVPGLLELASRLGAEVVQLCENTNILQRTGQELTEFRRQAEGLGILLEVGISGGKAEVLTQGIRTAEKLGATLLRAVVDSDGLMVEQVAEAIRKVLPQLKEGGITLCLENHFRFCPSQITELIRSVADERVMVCLDPLNSISLFQGPDEVIRQLAPFAKTAHVKDATIERYRTGWLITGCPLGMGKLNLEEYLKRLPSDLESLLLESWMDPLAEEKETQRKEREWVEAGLRWLKAHRDCIGNHTRSCT